MAGDTVAQDSLISRTLRRYGVLEKIMAKHPSPATTATSSSCAKLTLSQ